MAAQAVLAAGLTVSADRAIHAASMCFVQPGDTATPIEFEVTRMRDGAAITSRSVEALQHGRLIFTLQASFHRDERGLTHQVPALDGPPPDATPALDELFAGDEDNLRWATTLAEILQVDVRFPELPARASASRGLRAEPRQRAWLRARHRIAEGALHQAAALTYLSDALLLSAALGPHGLTLQSGRVQFATINHTVWFHHPCRVDEWFLYQQESRWADNARALSHGEIFDATGRLCATTIQEGLIRVKEKR